MVAFAQGRDSENTWGPILTVRSGYRFYNPSTGRWLNRDPIGEDGGLNLYVFVSNQSTVLFDPSGLSEFDAHVDIVLNASVSDLKPGLSLIVLHHVPKGRDVIQISLLTTIATFSDGQVQETISAVMDIWPTAMNLPAPALDKPKPGGRVYEDRHVTRPLGKVPADLCRFEVKNHSAVFDAGAGSAAKVTKGINGLGLKLDQATGTTFEFNMPQDRAAFLNATALVKASFSELYSFGYTSIWATHAKFVEESFSFHPTRDGQRNPDINPRPE
jgi:RHS repeat-associated protein